MQPTSPGMTSGVRRGLDVQLLIVRTATGVLHVHGACQRVASALNTKADTVG